MSEETKVLELELVLVKGELTILPDTWLIILGKVPALKKEVLIPFWLYIILHSYEPRSELKNH